MQSCLLAAHHTGGGSKKARKKTKIINSNKKMAQVWTLVVGGLVAAGGAMGYAKARSVPSLVAGVTCGALYGLSTLWMEPYQIGGNLAAVVISIILAVAMGRRFLASGKVMPGRC